jgi:hypothetical protein
VVVKKLLTQIRQHARGKPSNWVSSVVVSFFMSGRGTRRTASLQSILNQPAEQLGSQASTFRVWYSLMKHACMLLKRFGLHSLLFNNVKMVLDRIKQQFNRRRQIRSTCIGQDTCDVCNTSATSGLAVVTFVSFLDHRLATHINTIFCRCFLHW